MLCPPPRARRRDHRGHRRRHRRVATRHGSVFFVFFFFPTAYRTPHLAHPTGVRVPRVPYDRPAPARRANPPCHPVSFRGAAGVFIPQNACGRPCTAPATAAAYVYRGRRPERARGILIDRTAAAVYRAGRAGARAVPPPEYTYTPTAGRARRFAANPSSKKCPATRRASARKEIAPAEGRATGAAASAQSSSPAARARRSRPRRLVSRFFFFRYLRVVFSRRPASRTSPSPKVAAAAVYRASAIYPRGSWLNKKARVEFSRFFGTQKKFFSLQTRRREKVQKLFIRLFVWERTRLKNNIYC